MNALSHLSIYIIYKYIYNIYIIYNIYYIDYIDYHLWPFTNDLSIIFLWNGGEKERLDFIVRLNTCHAQTELNFYKQLSTNIINQQIAIIFYTINLSSRIIYRRHTILSSPLTQLKKIAVNFTGFRNNSKYSKNQIQNEALRIKINFLPDFVNAIAHTKTWRCQQKPNYFHVNVGVVFPLTLSSKTYNQII